MVLYEIQIYEIFVKLILEEIISRKIMLEKKYFVRLISYQMIATIKISKFCYCFDEKNIQDACVCRNEKNYSHRKKIRQINCLVISLVKLLLSRNFCKKSCKSTVQSHCGNYGNLLSLFFDKNFVKVTILLTKLLNSWFDESESKFFVFPHLPDFPMPEQVYESFQ